jgi:uncharacterized repeat protein (TIGR03806 family)
VLAIAMAAGLPLASCSSNGGRVPGFAGCTPPTGGVTLAQAMTQYSDLRDFCLVDSDGGQLIYNSQVVPYDLNTPLFSDYAIKARAVWVPPGQSATYQSGFDDTVTFPVGTVLIKTFSFAPDLRQPTVDQKMVETRLLVNGPGGWVALPYVWDDAQDDATLDIASLIKNLSFITPSGQMDQASYLVPAVNQCAQCHDAGTTLDPIGPKARQLNRDFDYETGPENQLDHWMKVGLLTGAPPSSSAPRLPVWSDPSTGTLDQRARAYLEANCMHCHWENGFARTTGLDLSSDETNPVSYGVCKPPVAAGEATGGRKYDIVPGQPDASILTYRLESTTPGIMMPLIGRSVVHTEGDQLIRDWITAMPGSCP